MSFAALLTQEQVERIHDASLELLEEVGLKVRYEPARELFKQHGCIVDGERVKFPREVVEKYRKLVPPTLPFTDATRNLTRRFRRIVRSL